MLARIFVCEEAHRQWGKMYISVIPIRPITRNKDIESILRKIGDRICKDKLHILQCKIYGVNLYQDNILSIYSKMIDTLCDVKRNCVPPTFIEGVPGNGGIFGGIQLIGASCSSSARIVSIQYDNKTVGACLEHHDGKELFLSGISGIDAKESDNGHNDARLDTKANKTRYSTTNNTEHEKNRWVSIHHAAQVENMFYNAQAVLQEFGASFHDVIRTWIYIPHILEWYGLFNRKRNEFFHKFGLFNERMAQVPASTGIQGKRLEGEECFMDLLAFISKNEKEMPWSRLSNPCQNEAYEYKSAFARAINVSYDGTDLVYLSGTASLDNDGKTCYQNDDMGQILHTLYCISSLLKQKQMSLNNLCLATVYCKNQVVYDKFVTIMDYLQIKDIPFLPVCADICRDDLLFEIDGIALKTKVGSKQSRSDKTGK